MATTIESTKKNRYRLDDSRLTLLVSQAALELDYAVRRENQSLGRVGEFFDFLKESLNMNTGSLRERWLDPETVNLFEHTLRRLGPEKELRTVQDVVLEAQRYMEGFDEQGIEPDLNAQLDFVVAFGNSLLAHRAQSRPQMPAHPYER